MTDKDRMLASAGTLLSRIRDLSYENVDSPVGEVMNGEIWDEIESFLSLLDKEFPDWEESEDN